MRALARATMLHLLSCVPVAFAAPASLDVDDDGAVLPATDGVLVIRHLFGFEGDSLTAGIDLAVAAASTPEIAARLSGLDRSVLDIDDDGAARPLTDGLLLLRYLFGFRHDALVAGAVGVDAKRSSSEGIALHMAVALQPSETTNGDGISRFGSAIWDEDTWN